MPTKTVPYMIFLMDLFALTAPAFSPETKMGTVIVMFGTGALYFVSTTVFPDAS